MKPLLLALLLAAPLAAQVAPMPDGGASGDKGQPALPSSPSGKADGGAAPGLPSDRRDTPPPTATAAPPASADSAPSPDAKAKGRTPPASETPPKPR